MSPFDAKKVHYRARGSQIVSLASIKDGCALTLPPKPRLIHVNKNYLQKVIAGDDGVVTHYYNHKNLFITHNTSGPAIFDEDNKNYKFFYNGFHIRKMIHFCFLCDIDDIDCVQLILKYGENI